LVSAFAADIGLVLGQTASAEKSNEITAIPALLAALALEGCIVTIDAMGTQTGIAPTIRNCGAGYVLCVKDNHPKLVESFLLAQAGVGDELVPSSTSETTDDGPWPQRNSARLGLRCRRPVSPSGLSCSSVIHGLHSDHA